MRIAIIGTGISGLVVARRLSAEHELVVFEAEDRIGGHTHTVEVEHAGTPYRIDTGFIVYNDWTYPHFLALLEELGVASQPSSMSFSVQCERTGLEYNGTNLDRLFVQRRNLLRPSFLRMVRDILRFNRLAPRLLAAPEPGPTLGAYLEEAGYSRPFVEHYIIPMGAAIWSARPRDMLEFPARTFIEFFANHGFLSVNDRPVWRVIRGGSSGYVDRLIAPFASSIRLRSPVLSLRRQPHQVLVRTQAGGSESFDAVFLACHSDEALRLLSDATGAEREVLGAIPYQANEVVLHTDTRLLPRRPRAWASWNYHLPATPAERATVTYDMNLLQGLSAPVEFLVTLNRSEAIAPERVLGRYCYHHPVFTEAAVRAQRRRAEIQGVRRTWYCGAYWGYGFHEDGVVSAHQALEDFRRGFGHAQPPLQRVG